ncbi:hypothetical protein TNCV_1272221 [Trichonephila clavipes]|nr:hypothetical protein TNCV_1272221 [Trichonephila clavipes]
MKEDLLMASDSVTEGDPVGTMGDRCPLIGTDRRRFPLLLVSSLLVMSVKAGFILVKSLSLFPIRVDMNWELTRFSFQSDSRWTLIWRPPGTRYHQENTIERHRYGGAGWLI